MVTKEELVKAQASDHTLMSIRRKAHKEEDRYYFNSFKVLCRQYINEFGEPTEGVVLPEPYRSKVFKAAHTSLVAGHFCDRKTLAKIYPYFTWPNINSDVVAWCRQCKYCQRYGTPKGNVAPLQPMLVVTEPWSTIAFDIVGPLSRTSRKNKYLLTCLDLATRYPEAIPVKSVDLPSLIEPFIQVFSQHGFPTTVLTDQGTNFTGKLFNKLCNLYLIIHLLQSHSLR